jgi:hypothetical protein
MRLDTSLTYAPIDRAMANAYMFFAPKKLSEGRYRKALLCITPMAVLKTMHHW